MDNRENQEKRSIFQNALIRNLRGVRRSAACQGRPEASALSFCVWFWTNAVFLVWLGLPKPCEHTHNLTVPIGQSDRFGSTVRFFVLRLQTTFTFRVV